MALNRTCVWKCDLCEATETTAGRSPGGWHIDVRVKCLSREASADICRQCYVDVFPCSISDGTHDVRGGEFQKPWWRKFFGKSEETTSGE